MALRTATTIWTGTFREGCGLTTPGSGAFESGCSFDSIFGDAVGTNGSELLASAISNCFSSACVAILCQAGFKPAKVSTTASTHLDKTETGINITSIDLDLNADVPEIDPETFQAFAQKALKTCPVCNALATVRIDLNAKLVGTRM